MVGNGMKVVLLAETEPALRNSIKRYLEKEDYEVRSYSKSKDLLRSLKLMENHVNMVLLGINIPSNLDLDVLRIIREMFYVPVILLSSIDSESVKVRGLKLGCDDVMIKPIALDELLARMEAIERRSHIEDHQLAKKEKMMNDSNIENLDVLKLSKTEHNMLFYLMKNKDSVVAKEELLREIWGINSSIKTRVTDDTLKRLRKKLSKSQAKIRIDTVRGIGYVAKEI